MERILPPKDMVVQPYQSSVESYGERSLLFLGGEYTHAIKRPPALSGDPGYDATAAESAPSAEDERAFARQVIVATGFELLYARVDVTRDEQGGLSPQGARGLNPRTPHHLEPPFWTSVNVIVPDVRSPRWQAWDLFTSGIVGVFRLRGKRVASSNNYRRKHAQRAEGARHCHALDESRARPRGDGRHRVWPQGR
ncbi:hypothetical protein [Archangium sp.]|uniref:hypothetical protein n=1 Tax=Archangium sp. TaxID=1872627 RepID=UPI00286B8ACE|nr:hypothetical protein [Archangium sp.]